MLTLPGETLAGLNALLLWYPPDVEANMRMEFEFSEDLCIVRLAGRFVTGSDAEILRAKKTLNSAGLRDVVADCRELPYLDSTGLSFLVGLHTTLSNSGRRLALAGVNSRVREVLGITRLDAIIPVYEDTSAALAALRGKGRAVTTA